MDLNTAPGFNTFKKIFTWECVFINSRERRREKEKELSMWKRNINQLPPILTLTGDQICNLLWDDAQTTEPPARAEALILCSDQPVGPVAPYVSLWTPVQYQQQDLLKYTIPEMEHTPWKGEKWRSWFGVFLCACHAASPGQHDGMHSQVKFLRLQPH